MATVREAMVLALSSRNAYLTPENRKVRRAAQQGLEFGCRAREGRAFPFHRKPKARTLITAGFDRVDYVALRDAATRLAPLAEIGGACPCALAARIGSVRLIDNMAV